MSDRQINSRFNCVILANGSEVRAEHQQHNIDCVSTSLWYLVEDSTDYYHLYKSSDIEQTLLVRGKNLAWVDPCTAPVASFHEEDYRWRTDKGIIILEYVPMELASLRLMRDGKAGIEEFIKYLPTRISSLTENQLRAFIYEIELLHDELDGMLSSVQEDWLHEIHDILMEESDARWFIERLRDRGIVQLEDR